MTHIWQGRSGSLRSGDWLTAARARGYGLILLGLCARRRYRLDRGLRRPDRPQRQADRHRLLQRLRRRLPDLAGPAGRRLCAGAAARRRKGYIRRPRGAVLRLALPAVLLRGRVTGRRGSLCLGPCDLADGELCRLSGRHPRHPAASRDVADRRGLSRRVRQYRPRPERISHRGTARRRAALARPKALAGGRADRPASPTSRNSAC